MTQVTIDLGKVKFNWRGTYDPTVAYTKDDVVHYGGSAWVAVNAVSALAPGTTSDWDLMALGGDPLSTMTTEGDLLVRGADGLERLPLGPANSFVKVNAEGDGVEYGVDNNAKLIQRVRNVYTAGAWENTTAMNWVPGLYYNFTPKSDTSTVKMTVGFTLRRVGTYDHLTEINTALSNPDGSSISYFPNRWQDSNHSATYQNNWNHYELETPSWGVGVEKRIGVLSAAHDYANYRAVFHQTTWNNYNQTGLSTNAYPYWIVEEWEY